MDASDPAEIHGDDARIAFWLNAYNDTLAAELDARPRRGNLLLQRKLFKNTTIELAGQSYSLNEIEHGLLRGNARPPGSFRRLLASDDPRLEAAPSSVDPRIHFALNCGAASCPVVRKYEPETLDETLELATRAYVEAESSLDRESGTLTLPGLMKLYRGDFGNGEDADLVAFAARYMPQDEADWIEANGSELRVRFGRFDWTFVARGL